MMGVGRKQDAARLFAEALELLRSSSPEPTPRVAIAMFNLAHAYVQTDRPAEGVPLFLEAIAILEKSLAENHPTLLLARLRLAEAYVALNRDAEAAPLLEAVGTGFRARFGEGGRQTQVAGLLRAEVYTRLGRFAAAETILTELAAQRSKGSTADELLQSDDPLEKRVSAAFVALYEASQRPDLADKYRGK